MSLVTNRNNIFKKGVVGNVRKAQEDSHDMSLDTPNGDLFVVCDGMGGHVGGEKASSLAVESIINYLKIEKYSDPNTALNGALQFANMQILGFANEHPEFKGMGTTACIVLLQSDAAYIAHVGDSRIYLYLGKEKQLHRITKDHSYVQMLVDAGKISDEQAEHHQNKNRILKALGVTPDLQPSFGKAVPKNGDIFLICSDGLSGMIPDRTIENVLGQSDSLAKRGELLINLAMQGETVQPGGQDNCTVELIEIDNSPWKKSEFTSYNPERIGEKKGFPTILKIAAIVVGLLFLLGLSGVYIKDQITVRAIDNNYQLITKKKKDIEYNNAKIRLAETNRAKAEDRYQEYIRNAQQSEMQNQLKIIDNSTKQIDSLKKENEQLSTEIVSLEKSVGSLKKELIIKKYTYESSNNR